MHQAHNRIRVLLVACLSSTALAGMALTAYYIGVWLAKSTGGGAADAAGPTLRLSARYESAPAQVVEDLVTVPLENALLGLAGIETIESFSREGATALTLYLRPGIDLEQALARVQGCVDQELPRLPLAVQKQGVTITKGGPLPALWVLVGSTDQSRSPLLLRRDAEIKLLPLVTTTPGVSAATAGPGLGPRLHVQLDPESLTAHQLSFAEVLRALREMPGAADRDLPPDLLPEFILRTDANGKVVLLKDVAWVERTGSEPVGVARWHGDAVAFVAVDGDDPTHVSEVVAERLPTWKRRLPRGTELHLLPGPTIPESEALLVEGCLPAATSPEQVRDMADRIATALQRVPDPQAEHLMRAILALPSAEPNQFRLYVALCPPAERAWTLAEVREHLREELKEYGDLISRVTSPSILERPPRLRGPLVLRISGPEMGEATQLAEEVFDRLSHSSVVTELWPEYAGVVPRLQLDVDRAKAQQLGVDVAEVLVALQVYRGPLEVQEVLPGLLVTMKPEGQDRLHDMNQLKIRNHQGEMVPLGSLVAIREVRTPAVLHRLDGQRCLLITAAPARGVPRDEACRHCRAVAAQVREDLGLPQAYKLECLEQAPTRSGSR